jgi:hypothetical protein
MAINDALAPGELSTRDRRQTSILQWARDTFGNGIEVSPGVRLMRFIEEATELAQAHGLIEADVHKVVSYVFARPKGDPLQEIGGVMVTLYGYAESVGAGVAICEMREIWRVNEKDPAHFKRRAAEKREAALVPQQQ